MSGRRVDWNGAFTAIVTPFTRDGGIDEALLKENIKLSMEEGNHGMVICGHGGEAHLMDDAERQRVIAIAVAEVNGHFPVVAGTGGINTNEVITRTRTAVAAGVDGVMIEQPFFMNPKKRDVIAHYARISDAVDVPIMFYNCPGRAGIDVDTETTVKLAEVARIVAVKDSAQSYLRMMELIGAIGDEVGIFIGPAAIWGFAGILMGAVGFVDQVQQVAGRKLPMLYDLAVGRDIDRGVALQHDLMPLRQLLFNSAGTSPATIKDAMRLMGRPGGYPRAPLQPMAGEGLAAFEAVLRDLGYLPKMAAE